MPAPSAGEVMLSRAETAALAALESEENEEHGLRRAQAESGLSRQQLQMLRRRADHLASKGYTLKGMNFIKKPLAASPDEPGLARSAKKPEDDAPQKKTTKAKETNGTALVERTPQGQDLYTCPAVDEYRLPTPNSLSEPETAAAAHEANSMTTLAALLAKRRRAKYSA